MPDWSKAKIGKQHYGTSLKARAAVLVLLVTAAFGGVGYVFQKSHQHRQNDQPSRAEVEKALTVAGYKPLDYYGAKYERVNMSYDRVGQYELKNSFRAVAPSGDTLDVHVVGTRSSGLSVRLAVTPP